MNSEQGRRNRNSFHTANPEHFWMMVSIGNEEDCWPWTGAKKAEGYGRVRLNGRPMTASRCAWTITNGSPGELHVLHSCHNPVCVNPRHLHLGDHSKNMNEKVEAGRAYRAMGDAHPRAKLTSADVLSIRRDTRPQKEIMAAYGIASSTVSQIKTRKRWPHLEDESHE